MSEVRVGTGGDGLSRRRFLAAVGSTALAAGAAPALRAFPAIPEGASDLGDIEEVSLAELVAALADGRTTAERLTAGYLERIEALDRGGPQLRSVIAVNPDAIAIARELDRERLEKGARGPLHGIPVLLKDNIDTRDLIATTAGSLALAENFAARDAFVAERLRAAGAVILGKTNLSEWANFRSTRSSSGWSAVGGQVKNPYALDRNPCGSSSGSGAAAAASLCAAAVGTETDGSIVCPSNACGIVGVKPTLGLVSRSGIVPIAHSQDTAGPMCRTVRDAAILLAAMAGEDPRDPATAASRGQAHAHYTTFLDPQGLRGARLGVVRQYFGFHEGVDRLMEDALAALKDAGAELVDPVELPKDSDYGEAEYSVLLFEFKADLARYLEGCPAAVTARTLKDLIAFNEEHGEREMPYFRQEIFERAEAKGSLESLEYQEARTRCLRLTREEGIDAAVAKHRLDALVAPTGGPAWVTDLVNGDHFGGGCSSPAAVAGYPNVTLPAGAVSGLPVGISFLGPAWSEPALLRIAFAFEQTTRHRRPPRLLPTAAL